MKYALLQTVEAGASLIPVVKHLNQDKIDMFGVLSGATGSVHVDPVYCANSPFKTTLAHGFLTMAYASEMMELNFGMDWATSGEIEVKFIGQAHPGDTVLTQGTVTKGVCAHRPQSSRWKCDGRYREPDQKEVNTKINYVFV